MTPSTPKQTRLIVTAVVVIAAFLMIPAIKKRLLLTPEPEAVEPQAA